MSETHNKLYRQTIKSSSECSTTNQYNIISFERHYFQYPYWIFADTVSVQSYTGFIYKTLSLEEALDDWVLGQENSDDYEYWCTSTYCSVFANHLPSFSGIDITDIRENKAYNEHVMLYPNPANGFVHIEGITASEVQIYNALGQLVKVVRETNEFNVAGLPGGVYLLRIKDVSGRKTWKAYRRQAPHWSPFCA